MMKVLSSKEVEFRNGKFKETGDKEYNEGQKLFPPIEINYNMTGTINNIVCLSVGSHTMPTASSLLLSSTSGILLIGIQQG